MWATAGESREQIVGLYRRRPARVHRADGAAPEGVRVQSDGAASASMGRVSGRAAGLVRVSLTGPGTAVPEGGSQAARTAGQDGGSAASEREDRSWPAHQAGQDGAKRISGTEGAHPGSPGTPAGPEDPAGPAGPPPPRADKRLYFALMGTCIGLFVIAWAVVERYSVTAAVIISAVALAIPPFAVVIANVASATDRRRP